MFGLRKENGSYIFKAAVKTEQLYLNLYMGNGNRRVRQVAFDPSLRIGDVWTLIMSESEENIEKYSYAYEADGHVFSDPYGSVFAGRDRFGNLKDGVKILKTPIREALAVPEYSDEWMKDVPLEIPYSNSVIYRMHVRGFTMHSSSGLSKEVRGTFQGIIEKIPYLKELGINTIELMPAYEFNEVMLPNFGRRYYDADIRPTGQINYWGFTQDALQMAPKAAYTSGFKNPRTEFQSLVLKLHQSGIEIIVDLYFTYNALPDYISSVMRFWRITYHVDGIHLIGYAPFEVIARDPYLSRFKIWADSWDGCETWSNYYDYETVSPEGEGSGVKTVRRYLADYNDGFQNDMRKTLKGDESMLYALMERIRSNPEDRANIQFMANVSGMTMMDMLSYDRKHNEANKEQNRDGTDQNYSWNCGEEGVARRKSVRLLRKKMLRNAFVLLLLSQGTPLIMAGDEFGHSKKGNNNSYCEDDDTNWLNWRLLEKNHDLYEFAKYMIYFRHRHGVFRQARQLRGLDYRNVGIPDISFHGENAWRPEFENFRRQLGVMYAGEYANDDGFLVLYNFHWEAHTFGLANPPAGRKWAAAIDTSREDLNGIFPEGEEEIIEDKEKVVEPRSIMVLRAVPDLKTSLSTRKSRRRQLHSQAKSESQAESQQGAPSDPQQDQQEEAQEVEIAQQEQQAELQQEQQAEAQQEPQAESQYDQQVELKAE